MERGFHFTYPQEAQDIYFDGNDNVADVLSMLRQTVGEGDLFVRTELGDWSLKSTTPMSAFKYWKLLYFVNEKLLAFSDPMCTREADNASSSSSTSNVTSFPAGTLVYRTVHINLPDGRDIVEHRIPMETTVGDWIVTRQARWKLEGGYIVAERELLADDRPFAEAPYRELHFYGEKGPNDSGPKEPTEVEPSEPDNPVIQQLSLAVVWRAIVRNQLTYANNAWTINDGSEWAAFVPKLLNRDCYGALLTKLNIANPNKGLRGMLVTGTPGIGKSLFLLRLLIEIHGIYPEKDVNFTLRSGVNYFLRASDGSITERQGKSEFWLSDAHDIPCVYIGTQHVLACSFKGEENYKLFAKQLDDMKGRGETEYMDVFSLAELKKVKPAGMRDDEVEFRFLVFGGSARSVFSFQNVDGYYDASGMVYEIMELMFKHIPLEFKIRAEHRLAKKIATLKAGDVSMLTSSMFCHISSEGKGFWASAFMCILAQEMIERKDVTVVGFLKSAIQNSGLGFLHEALGHLKLMRMGEVNVVNLGNGELEKLKVPANAMIFRGVDDMSKVTGGYYGIPHVCNCALIDAYVPPDTAYQYTLSRDHQGAEGNLPAIQHAMCEAALSQMSTEARKQWDTEDGRHAIMSRQKLVYVVRKGECININQSLTISQYFTYADPVTPAFLLSMFRQFKVKKLKKAEISAELTRLNIKHSPRDTRDVLLELLLNSIQAEVDECETILEGSRLHSWLQTNALTPSSGAGSTETASPTPSTVATGDLNPRTTAATVSPMEENETSTFELEEQQQLELKRRELEREKQADTRSERRKLSRGDIGEL